jgi:hypothetical protein
LAKKNEMRDEWEAGAWKKKARQVEFALPETKLDVQRVARGRRGQSGTESRAKLSKLLLKRCVGRLCFGKISRLQILAQSGEKLFEGILRDGETGRASGMMMVARCGGRLLEVLAENPSVHPGGCRI